ncbi:MAG: acireductone synthase [Acidobacteriota bacterium]|nr:acireductone synthase [Acidobacteriota bacterium]
MISTILMDIEGTTTSIDFVHRTLFPYARERMASFLADHADDASVRACVNEVVAVIAEEQGRNLPAAEVADVLIGWIDADRKQGALKRLQGMIWKYGYQAGDYTAHLYDDVKPCWHRWKAAGKTLAIYSSGSVPAQKLLFGHTVHGDLNEFLSAYFDTSSGHKRESQSYRNIATALNVSASSVLFLSDVPAELDAAREAGMQTTQLVRPGTQACTQHPTVADFTQIVLQ